MKVGSHDIDNNVFIIAEIGNNHEGSFDLCEKMIHSAADAGAHAVKLQTIRAERLVGYADQARLERLKSFELEYVEFAKLSKVARDRGLMFISTPFDLESVEALNSMVDAYKISSGDNNFYPLIESVARTGKPIIMSTGLGDTGVIKKSKELIYDIWNKIGVEQELALLHCVSSYPVEADQANLRAIKSLKLDFDCTVGYSDHTIGIGAALAAVALGARIIEKHFTIDKNYSDFRDHQLSADPHDFIELVSKIKTVSDMLGDGKIVPQKSEQENIFKIRRSIVASRDLKNGDTITWDDIMWVRPSGGLPPGEEDRIMGKSLNSSLSKGDLILESHIK